jgi:hypothetical protein
MGMSSIKISKLVFRPCYLHWPSLSVYIKLPLLFLRVMKPVPPNVIKCLQNYTASYHTKHRSYYSEYTRTSFWRILSTPVTILSIVQCNGGKTPYISSFSKQVRHLQNCHSDTFHLYNAYWGLLHSAMFCIDPPTILSVFLFSIPLAEPKQNQDQSELNFSGSAARSNFEKKNQVYRI